MKTVFSIILFVIFLSSSNWVIDSFLTIYVVQSNSTTFLNYLFSDVSLSIVTNLHYLFVNQTNYCESLLFDFEIKINNLLDYLLLIVCYYLGLRFYWFIQKIRSRGMLSFLITELIVISVIVLYFIYIILLIWIYSLASFDWFDFIFDYQSVNDTISDQFIFIELPQVLNLFLALGICFVRVYAFNFCCLSLVLILNLENFIMSVFFVLFGYLVILLKFLTHEYII